MTSLFHYQRCRTSASSLPVFKRWARN